MWQERQQHFNLLLNLTKREFKIRYLGSVLGSYWNLIHPLMMILIYTLVFSRVMHNRLPNASSPWSYSIYLCSALLPWTFFQEVLQRNVTALLDNATFLKKISFPPGVLFGATVASAGINFAIAFFLFSLFLLVVKPVSALLFAVYLVIVALFALFGLGLGVGLGCLFVFLRDIQQMVAITMQLWFWFTPVIYLYDSLPSYAQKALLFNPAFPFVQSLHGLIYFEVLPSSQFWLLMLGWTLVSLLVGQFIYRKSIVMVRDYL